MIVTPEEVYIEYQRAKGRWSKPPYIANSKYNFKKIQQRPDWLVFSEIAKKINQSNGINLQYFIYGLFYENKENIKKVYPRKFLNKEATTAYIKYVEHINTISNKSQVDIIKVSKIMIHQYMNEHKLETFKDYLEENIDIYPTFLTHLQTGLLNYYIFTAYYKCDSVIKRLNGELLEDIQHYLNCKDAIKLRVLTITEFTEATDNALKELGV